MTSLLFATCWGLPAQAQEYLWCFDRDTVEFRYDALASLLIIEHRAAMYNCCPEPVRYDVTLGQDLVTVTEMVGADPPCDCICCFNLKAEVSDLPAGLWTVRFTWLNEEDGQWQAEQAQVAVPVTTPAADGVEARDWISGCLDAAAVPDPPPGPSWDSLKALYR